MILLRDLRRNDVKGSIVYYRQCLKDGTWSADQAEALFGLHDDPDKLIDAIALVPPPGQILHEIVS